MSLEMQQRQLKQQQHMLHQMKQQQLLVQQQQKQNRQERIQQEQRRQNVCLRLSFLMQHLKHFYIFKDAYVLLPSLVLQIVIRILLYAFYFGICKFFNICLMPYR